MSTVKENLIYLFHIDLKNKKQLYLTSSNDNIVYEGRKYLPYSGLNLLSGKFNDSAENHILLHGIFDSLGITKEDEIKGSSIKIIYSVSELYRHFVTYICTEYQVYDLEFKIKCEPEAIKYNQSLLQVFSKACRANFGDTKCKINISDYEVSMSIKSVPVIFAKSVPLIIKIFTSFSLRFFKLLHTITLASDVKDRRMMHQTINYSFG